MDPSIGLALSGGALTTDQLATVSLRIQLDEVNAKMLSVDADAKRISADPNRSPSPPPKYDTNGARINTRDIRMREKLVNERNIIMSKLVQLNPALAKLPGFKAIKLTRKVYIPQKEFPTHNFMGLIIGPRGNTHRRMETESGCKISIRGRGSVKDGRGGNKPPDADDELHVLITGDTEEQVDSAEKMVQELLVPVDDENNVHKQKQLR